MNLELEGKIALVTGSTRGIGNAIANRLAEEGARVVLNGRDVQNIEKAVRETRAAGGIAADVTDVAATERMLQSVSRDFGKLDVLICNVGSGASVPPGTESNEEWQRMLAVNLFSATNTLGKATPLLRESRGVALCISSICGIEALGCPLGYSSAKAALNSYVRGVARTLGKHGVRVNAIAPGNILFPGSVWEKKLKETPGQVAAMLEEEVALGRFGNTTDVADLAAFLVSPRSGFATGALFVLDGGQVRS